MTDGSENSRSSENESRRSLEHSQSTSPGTKGPQTFAQFSLTKKVSYVVAALIAIKFGAVMAFGDNAYITALLDLLLQSLQGAASN